MTLELDDATSLTRDYTRRERRVIFFTLEERILMKMLVEREMGDFRGNRREFIRKYVEKLEQLHGKLQ